MHILTMKSSNRGNRSSNILPVKRGHPLKGLVKEKILSDSGSGQTKHLISNGMMSEKQGDFGSIIAFWGVRGAK